MGKKRKEPTLYYGEEHLDKLRDDPAPYVDLETSGLSPWRDKIAVVTLYSERADAVVVAHPRGKVSQRLKKFLSSRDELTGHNLAGFDLLLMANAGIDVFSPALYDTMLAEGAILTSDRRDISVSLKSTVQRRVGRNLKKDNDHSGWMNPRLTDEQLAYCKGDVKELANLRRAQAERADSDQLNAIRVECDLVPAIVKMTLNGLPVNEPKFRRAISDQKVRAAELKEYLHEKLGAINLGSPVQLKKAMNEWLVEHGDRPMTGTSVQVLEEQARLGGDFGEICEGLMEWRHAAQRIKMYGNEPEPPRKGKKGQDLKTRVKQDWIEKFVIDGRVHPRWWTTRTDTMRMSCSDPNLQQWPRDFREVVGGVPGHVIIKCDLQQIEVRMAAAVANCPGLKRAFSEGKHIHTDIASRAFNIPYDEVATVEEGKYKQLAKALTFTMLFGGGWETFQTAARRAKVYLSEAECLKIFADFFDSYPGMRELKREAGRLCRNKVVVLKLPTGVKRVLAGWQKTPSRVMNTLIQGGAAAGLKFGMLEAYRRGLFEYVGAAVHDELVALAPVKMADEVAAELQESMNYGQEQVMGDVPSVAAVKRGKWWS